jgi:hypothetical protein
LLRVDLIGGFIPIDLHDSVLVGLQHVDPLDGLSRVLLKEEHKVLGGGLVFDDFDQSLSLFAVQLSRQDPVGDGGYHQLFVRLSGKTVFNGLWLYFWIYVEFGCAFVSPRGIIGENVTLSLLASIT